MDFMEAVCAFQQQISMHFLKNIFIDMNSSD